MKIADLKNWVKSSNLANWKEASSDSKSWNFGFCGGESGFERKFSSTRISVTIFNCNRFSVEIQLNPTSKNPNLMLSKCFPVRSRSMRIRNVNIYDPVASILHHSNLEFVFEFVIVLVMFGIIILSFIRCLRTFCLFWYFPLRNLIEIHAHCSFVVVSICMCGYCLV